MGVGGFKILMLKMAEKIISGIIHHIVKGVGPNNIKYYLIGQKFRGSTMYRFIIFACFVIT